MLEHGYMGYMPQHRKRAGAVASENAESTGILVDGTARSRTVARVEARCASTGLVRCRHG